MSKSFWRVGLTLLAASFVWTTAGRTPATHAAARPRLGTVTGMVRDHKGKPLAGAVIRFMREGADHVVKQTSTGGDGAFTARILPGKYLLTALAEGFGSVSFNSVQVNPAAEISYRFNLEPVGEGRTAPERRADRNDPKWRLRSAQNRRSVFQIDGRKDSTVAAAEAADATEAAADDEAATDFEVSSVAGGEVLSRGGSNVHGLVEIYTGVSAGPLAQSFSGANFAFATPAGDDLNLIFAGQFATNGYGRLETTARFRVGDAHRVSATVGGATLPVAPDKSGDGFKADALKQLSVRAVDEWIVREGVVVVLGLDYSRFVGREGGGASSLSPRLGFAFDADSRTRVQMAYAPGGSSTRTQSGANFEGGPVVFTEANGQPVAFVDGRAVMERSQRLEFGVERVLDNDSMVEATAFFDTTDGRGVGLLSLPLNSLAGGDGGAGLMQTANQSGAARGVRVVYTRRVSRHLNTSAGYSFGRGQELSPDALSAAPGDLFRAGLFQTAAAQLESSFRTGTRVRTVLRFSPRAAVFAVDPFAGRVAVFDPSLSILVTQELPTFGLPLRAEAVVDARNLLDSQTCVEDGETVTAVNANRRTVRGGISVRF